MIHPVDTNDQGGPHNCALHFMVLGHMCNEGALRLCVPAAGIHSAALVAGNFKGGQRATQPTISRVVI